MRTSCEQLQGCGASTGFPRDVSPLHFAALSPRGGEGAFLGDVVYMGVRRSGKIFSMADESVNGVRACCERAFSEALMGRGRGVYDV